LPDNTRAFCEAKGRLYVVIKDINNAGTALHAGDLEAAAKYNPDEPDGPAAGTSWYSPRAGSCGGPAGYRHEAMRNSVRMRRCPCCKHWIGPATLLLAGTRLVCPSCWAIFKIDIAKGLAAGFIFGFVIFPLVMIAVGDNVVQKIVSNPLAARVLAFPFFVALLAGRLFSSLELEEPPTDSTSKP
jgi:hypothetical protein